MILVLIGWFLYCLDRENILTKVIRSGGASNGDLQFDLDRNLQGHLKVKSNFINGSFNIKLKVEMTLIERSMILALIGMFLYCLATIGRTMILNLVDWFRYVLALIGRFL